MADWLFPPEEGARRPHGSLPPLLVVLTVVSGLVDAVTFLGIDHVFVANMTGNVVFLGFALAGDRELSGTASLLALGASLAGAAAGGRLGRRSGNWTVGRVVGAQTVLVAGALGAALAGAGQLTRVGLLAFGMGLQNGVVHRLKVPDLATTVVTRTLAGLAADPWRPAAVRRIVSVLALLCGALAGGLLTLHVDGRWALGAAVALLAWVAWRAPKG